jgi:8-oxo-dGTP pyrophosphatase MutT (NUDIX family)
VGIMSLCTYTTSASAPHRTELHFASVIPEPDLVWGVRVFVLDEQRHLLMVQEDNGDWVVPGGGKEDDETIFETARRELIEETGVVIKNIRWFAYDKFIVEGDRPEGYRRYCPVAYTAYAFAEIDHIGPHIPQPDCWQRAFFPLHEAVRQEGILTKNRHIVLDRLIHAQAINDN